MTDPSPRRLGFPKESRLLKSADFDAVFIPGGHGPMEDLAEDQTMGSLLTQMLPDPSKVVASVCHGPASFLTATDAGPRGEITFREVVQAIDELGLETIQLQRSPFSADECYFVV